MYFLPIDIDAVHAALQIPATFVLWSIAILLAMRAHAMTQPRRTPIETDPVITGLLAAYLLIIAVKQSYWQLQGLLKALDLDAAAERLASGPYLPMICNAVATVVGGVLVIRVAVSITGARAYFIVPAVTCSAVGVWLIATARGGL